MPPPITTCNKNVYKLLKSSVTTLIPYTVVSAVLRCIAVNRPLAPAVLQFRPVDSPTKPITKLHWLAPVFSSYHCSMSETTASVNVTDPRAITRDVFSATLGSVCCCYTGQPFDTVKVRMQTNPTQFNGVMSSTILILRNEGIAAFWKGAVPTALGMAAENAMAFGVNEALKRAFPDEKKPITESQQQQQIPSLLKPFVMGAITGCCAALVLLPSEIVKAKLQVVVGKNVTAQEIMKQMVSKQGMKSYFIGLDAQLVRDASFYGMFFGGYELSCYIFRTHIPWMPEELNYFLSGGLAGMGGWLFAMPFDVPKTNVQSRYDTKVIGSYIPEFVKIANQRGIGGLYMGLGPTLVRAFPANAALFLGVELGKRFFDQFLWNN